jgi:hypothetical protein
VRHLLAPAIDLPGIPPQQAHWPNNHARVRVLVKKTKPVVNHLKWPLNMLDAQLSIGQTGFLDGEQVIMKIVGLLQNT